MSTTNRPTDPIRVKVAHGHVWLEHLRRDGRPDAMTDLTASQARDVARELLDAAYVLDGLSDDAEDGEQADEPLGR